MWSTPPVVKSWLSGSCWPRLPKASSIDCSRARSAPMVSLVSELPIASSSLQRTREVVTSFGFGVEDNVAGAAGRVAGEDVVVEGSAVPRNGAPRWTGLRAGEGRVPAGEYLPGVQSHPSQRRRSKRARPRRQPPHRNAGGRRPHRRDRSRRGGGLHAAAPQGGGRRRRPRPAAARPARVLRPPVSRIAVRGSALPRRRASRCCDRLPQPARGVRPSTATFLAGGCRPVSGDEPRSPPVQFRTGCT